MQLSSISPNTSVSQQWQSLLQRREDFSELAQALQDGDLAGAQRAYAALQGLQQKSAASGSPAQTDFASLGAALGAGNLSQAQSDFAQLKNDSTSASQNGVSGVHKRHGRHHHTENSDSSTSTSSDSTTNWTSSTTGTSVNLTA